MSARGASLAHWWVARYTRGLPDDVRDRRRDEIHSDVFEQLHAGDGRAVAWRAVRGVHADLAWRREERRLMQASHRPPSRLRGTWGVLTQNWFAPIAVLVGVFNVLFAIAVATDDGGKMPGQAIGPVILSLFAGLLFGGLWLRWRSGKARTQPARSGSLPVPTRWVAGLLAVLVVSLGLLVVGVSAGSPAFFFLAFGVLAVAAAVLAGVGVTRAVRSADPDARVALASGMIVAGVLPALAMFWMIVPPVLALVVIAGVLTTVPRVRPA